MRKQRKLEAASKILIERQASGLGKLWRPLVLRQVGWYYGLILEIIGIGAVVCEYWYSRFCVL